MARFTSVDPVFDGPGPYAYVDNNPNSYSDPKGESREDKQTAESLLKELRALYRQFVLLEAQKKDEDRLVLGARKQGMSIVDGTRDSTGPHALSTKIGAMKGRMAPYESQLEELGYSVKYNKSGGVSIQKPPKTKGGMKGKLGTALLAGVIESFLTRKAVAEAADQNGIPVGPISSVYDEGLNRPAEAVQEGGGYALVFIGVLGDKRDYRESEGFLRRVEEWWTGSPSKSDPPPDSTADPELLEYCGVFCQQDSR